METWTYIPADRRIVDENGLTIAHGVLPDDAPDILRAPHVPALVDALRRAGRAMVLERDPTAPFQLAAVQWAELVDHVRASLRAVNPDPVCPRCGRPPSSYGVNEGDCSACRMVPIGSKEPPAVDPLSIAREALRFYANAENWKEQESGIGMYPGAAESDGGNAARVALKTLEGV